MCAGYHTYSHTYHMIVCMIVQCQLLIFVLTFIAQRTGLAILSEVNMV